MNNLTFDATRNFGITSALIGSLSIIYAFFTSYKLNVIFLSVFGTLCGLTAIVLLIFSKGLTGLTRKMGVPEFVVKASCTLTS